MMLTRSRGFLLSCLFSFVITSGLLLLMRHLVATTDAAFEEGPPLKKLVFMRTVEDPEPPPRRPPPERPKPPVPPPPPLDDMVDLGPDGEPGPLAPILPERPGHVGLDVSEARMPIPFLTPAPEYPQRALARGVEGSVLVSFTIAETGAVVDATVVDADPPGVFDAAALGAIVRYWYRPQLVGGVPTPTPGMLLRIYFELEN